MEEKKSDPAEPQMCQVPGFVEALLVGSGGGRLWLFLVVGVGDPGGLVLGRGAHADGAVGAHRVVPVDPLGGGELDIVDALPGAVLIEAGTVADELGLVQRVERLGQALHANRTRETQRSGIALLGPFAEKLVGFDRCAGCLGRPGLVVLSHARSRFTQRPTPLSDTSQPLPYGNRAPRTKSHFCGPGVFGVAEPSRTGAHQPIREEFSDSEPITGRRVHRYLTFRKVGNSGSHSRAAPAGARTPSASSDPTVIHS